MGAAPAVDPTLVILQGVVGSHAYGLATPESDVDRHGIFQVPTTALLGLERPAETVVTTGPDATYHELGKFARLALAGNPAVLELLYLDAYEVLTPAGAALVAVRRAFLSQRVRATYGGYAVQQAKRLLARGDGTFGSDVRRRSAKHARHCFRLLHQGAELLTTGTLTVRLADPEAIRAAGTWGPEELAARFEAAYDTFRASPSVLPEEPDRAAIERVLVGLRLGELARAGAR